MELDDRIEYAIEQRDRLLDAMMKNNHHHFRRDASDWSTILLALLEQRDYESQGLSNRLRNVLDDLEDYE